MIQLASKYNDSSPCYDVIITQKNLKIDYVFGDFSCDINYNSKIDKFRDVFFLIIYQ